MLALSPSPLAVSEPRIRLLGTIEYAEALERMREFTRVRGAETRDEIWLVEHPPVYTLGQAGRAEHLRAATTLPVVRTERGGQITYHGPGQVVAYLLIDLRRRGVKVRQFVHLIEAAALATLADFGVKARRVAGQPGVYVEVDGALAKIAALGLKVSNGATFHGMSLNVAMDLEPYEAIDVCGYPGLRALDLASLGVAAEPTEVARVLGRHLVSHLQAKESDENDA